MAYRFSMFWWKLRCASVDVRKAFGYLIIGERYGRGADQGSL